MNSKQIYEEIAREDRELLKKQRFFGIYKTAEEAKTLAKKCADNYRTLWENNLRDEAEDLRMWSFFWSTQYKEATGKLEFFGMRE